MAVPGSGQSDAALSLESLMNVEVTSGVLDVHENRLVFDVRLNVAHAQGLMVSSRLLNLAGRTVGAGPGARGKRS